MGVIGQAPVGHLCTVGPVCTVGSASVACILALQSTLICLCSEVSNGAVTYVVKPKVLTSLSENICVLCNEL